MFVCVLVSLRPHSEVATFVSVTLCALRGPRVVHLRLHGGAGLGPEMRLCASKGVQSVEATNMPEAPGGGGGGGSAGAMTQTPPRP